MVKFNEWETRLKDEENINNAYTDVGIDYTSI